jgi:replicative DNA helicase
MTTTREAEQALLGAILLRPQIFRQARVVEEEFSDPRDRRIFKAMADLEVDGRPVDTVLISQHLNDHQVIPYLNQLAEHVGTSANWLHYDRRVREHSVKRKLAALAECLGQWTKTAINPAKPSKN